MMCITFAIKRIGFGEVNIYIVGTISPRTCTQTHTCTCMHCFNTEENHENHEIVYDIILTSK